MTDDPVMADKLNSQSAVSFGHMAKASRNTTCEVPWQRKTWAVSCQELLMLLCQATARYVENRIQGVPSDGRISPLHFLSWGSSQEKVLVMVINGTVQGKRIYITFTSLVGVFFHTVMLFTAIFVWTRTQKIIPFYIFCILFSIA